MRMLMYSTLIVFCLYQTALAQTDSESSGDIAYAISEGWIGQKYPDGNVYVSAVFNNGEKCVLTVFQMRPHLAICNTTQGPSFVKSSIPIRSETACTHIRRSSWERA